MSGILTIVRLIGVILAIVAAFVAIPHVGAALVILGLIAGIDVEEDRRLHVLVSALVLTGLNGALANIPAVGTYLADIAGNLGIAFAGVAFTVIGMAVFQRITDFGGGASAEAD